MNISMRLFKLLLALFLINGCARPDYKFDFDEKWTILEFKLGDKKINENFRKSSLLSNFVYPAIRFRNIDSTALWPGFESEKNRFKFSVDKSFSEILFKRIDSVKYEESELYIRSICQSYTIKKDKKLGRVYLFAKNDSIKIKMVPTALFVKQVEASKMD